LLVQEVRELFLLVSTERVYLAVEARFHAREKFYGMVPRAGWGELIEVFLVEDILEVVKVAGDSFFKWNLRGVFGSLLSQSSRVGGGSANRDLFQHIHEEEVFAILKFGGGVLFRGIIGIVGGDHRSYSAA
jgi:hypothetical protein